MPGRFPYILAVLALIAGDGGAAYFLISRLNMGVAGFERVLVPGTAELSLEAGTYTIFHEPRSVFAGKYYASDNIAGLGIAVASQSTGASVPLSVAGGSRYTAGGHSGSSIFTFDIAEPGRYRLSGAYDVGAPGPPAVLAVSRGFLSNLLLTIFGTIGMVFAGFAIAIPLAVVTFIRRRRARAAG